MKLNQAQKRAASFIAAVLVVAIGSMFFEPACQAITSTIAAAALLGLPAAFVFLVGFTRNTHTASHQKEVEHA